MGMEKRLPVLRVMLISDAAFERYLILDELDRTWTGERFDSTGGILYADCNHAALDTHNILKRCFQGCEARKYEVPLVVEVYARYPVSVDEIALYLSRASRLQIDTTDHGNGPGTSLVLPRIEWHRIQPAKEISHE